MFTQGQLLFAVFFVVVFIIAMIYSYRKDIKLHRKYYKGSYIILLGFFVFIGFLFFIKGYLKH
ncbi:preprotein translocase subunit YajC [Flavobacterium arsenatis]|uniref:Preprotein translocase subunit YajC n=1 Tax=Flavobacterium arsenatis TaxID=1484332 RepID=A0ABU1TMM4_9FLAO|nr:preprotein translocase subunit YajC [Flavobacterium arsenatis]